MQRLYVTQDQKESEPAIEVLLELDPFKTGSSGSSTVTVTEKSHGRSASGTVRFRNVVSFDGITKSVMENSSGFTIASVVDTNNYTINSFRYCNCRINKRWWQDCFSRSCHIGGLMSFTLTTLKSTIQDYSENNETTFVNNLREFIRSTENQNI